MQIGHLYYLKLRRNGKDLDYGEIVVRPIRFSVFETGTLDCKVFASTFWSASLGSISPNSINIIEEKELNPEGLVMYVGWPYVFPEEFLNEIP